MMIIVIKVYEMGGLVLSYFYGVFIRLKKKAEFAQPDERGRI